MNTWRVQRYCSRVRPPLELVGSPCTLHGARYTKFGRVRTLCDSVFYENKLEVRWNSDSAIIDLSKESGHHSAICEASEAVLWFLGLASRYRRCNSDTECDAEDNVMTFRELTKGRGSSKSKMARRASMNELLPLLIRNVWLRLIEFC